MIYFNNNMMGSHFWLNSKNLSFQEIQKSSNVNAKWTKQNFLNNDILQPINVYAFNFIHKPDIILENDQLILRQKTHAEIWLEEINGVLYAVDKPQQRQFYPSAIIMKQSGDFFIPTFKFYTPWIINDNVTCLIKSSPGSLFFVNHTVFNFKKKDNEFVEPAWADFLIKKSEKFIKNKYEIVSIGEPMFDIIIKDKKVIERILDEKK